MNIRFIKKIILTSLFFNFLLSGTIFLSRSLDSISRFSKESNQVELSGNGSELGGLFSETNAIGYYHNVWEKRKVKYNVNLGFEYMQNDNFNFLSFYTMINYLPIKQITTSFLVGLNFYDHDNEYSNTQDYFPDSKGGQIYGLVFTYNVTNKIPLSIDYKVYTFSEVQDDIWFDFEYSRCGISLGYKF